ncbi:MAG TPA: hypothetical protein VIC86_04390 [Acidimicrobiales bacterium]
MGPVWLDEALEQLDGLPQFLGLEGADGPGAGERGRQRGFQLHHDPD